MFDMKTTYVDVFAHQQSKRKESLGLNTSLSFELQLLERAAKGKKAFETFRGHDLTIPQQIL